MSKIFVPLPGKYTYLAEELYTLKLRPSFIKEMADRLKLTYVEVMMSGMEGNLCFAEDREVRPEYRTTFDRLDLVKHIFSQLPGETVNIERDEVVFREHLFLINNQRQFGLFSLNSRRRSLGSQFFADSGCARG
ncbi:MAG: hypothetical protein IPL46_04770 [Saprospiraceae bacterium]|nr:hypothetical protein [Saprospiraceae bacterium]